MALTKNEIKFIRSLFDKKERITHKLFVVEGVKLLGELASQTNFRIQHLYHTSDFDAREVNCQQSSLISDNELSRISGLVSPNKVLAVVAFPDPEALDYADDTILVLDDVKDPGNLGTILRTAEWFGIKQIFASENSVDRFNPKVVQASMGSIFRINYNCMNLPALLRDLKKQNYYLAGADLSGENAFKATFPKKLALVMGSESHGIGVEVKSLLDGYYTIPAFGQTESLNVSMAAGILLALRKKQLD